jgi:hypothetical protein
MKRRTFLHSGSATAVSVALTACGGGGGEDATLSESELEARRRIKPTPAPTPEPTPAPTAPPATPAPTAPPAAPAPAPATGPVYQDGTARINALLGTSLNVAIPAGTYMITGQLNVLNGHVISAAPGAQVTLKTAATYAGTIVTAYDKSFTLRGLTFDGAYADRRSLEGSENAILIQVIGGSNVILENNQFLYAPSYAIWAWKSVQMQVRGNTFLECYQPIRMDGSNLASGVIENNTFTNTTAFKSIQHIDALATVNLTVRGNTMGGAGLAEPTSHGYEGTWGNSIYLVNSTGYLVESNRVNANYWSAVVSGGGSTNGIVRKNYLSEGVKSTASVWIEQPGAAFITVDSNELDGGISVGDGGGDNLTITNNTIRSRSVGIDVNTGAKKVLIQGNQFFSKAGYRHENGMYLWGKETPDVNVQVINNSIQGFDKGIAINNSFGRGHVYGIRLNGNTFANNNENVWIPSTIVLHAPLGQ